MERPIILDWWIREEKPVKEKLSWLRIRLRDVLLNFAILVHESSSMRCKNLLRSQLSGFGNLALKPLCWCWSCRRVPRLAPKNTPTHHELTVTTSRPAFHAVHSLINPSASSCGSAARSASSKVPPSRPDGNVPSLSSLRKRV